MLTPPAVWALIANDDNLALWLCLFAGSTDFLDGFLARRLGVVSRAGAILDPLADKFMLDALYLAAWLWRGVGAGAIVVARDLLIVGGSLLIHAKTGRRDFPPTASGKLSTVIQIGWLVAYLAHSPGLQWMTWILIAVTLISGLDYARAGWRMLREPPRPFESSGV